ncbi:MAG: hypothetical protein EAZ27_00775 [Cytophagales bacterium]|nr:MAG: hypothetical protein EAZ27_00775 [Cytophagales bacterium]
MPTLRSHTHLQAAQADTQAKACKRVCLPNLTTANKAYCRKEKLKLSLGFAKLAVQLGNSHLKLFFYNQVIYF